MQCTRTSLLEATTVAPAAVNASRLGGATSKAVALRSAATPAASNPRARASAIMPAPRKPTRRSEEDDMAQTLEATLREGTHSRRRLNASGVLRAGVRRWAEEQPRRIGGHLGASQKRRA
jgi:hypothetical protein